VTATRQGLWWTTGPIAAAACWLAFYASGGLNLEAMTTAEMALTLLSGAIVAAAVLRACAAPLYGAWPTALLLALTALSGLSVVWSVAPDGSWHDAGRMLAYAGVFAASVAFVRLAPGRWPAVLGGLALASVAVCGFALLTNMFPGSLVAPDHFARLQEPYGYWNALGLTAAMGAICCLWLGARRSGHALLSALAYPAMGLVLLTLLLAYSRGALVALAVGLLLWFCVVPLRLRSAAVLIVAGLGAGAVGAWDFSTHALSAEGVSLAQRSAAGHQLAALTAAMLVALLAAGVAIGFATGRHAPSAATRRQAAAALWTAIALALIAFAGVLAHSQRGLTGTISHSFSALTNPNAQVPPNTPGRLTAVASVRARYWKEALQVFKAHPALGSGAEGFATAHLRYLDANLEVRHAHGFIVQTLADLGLVGLALALALLFTWMAAAGRATHPFNRRWASWGTWLRIRAGARPGWQRHDEPYPPERIGMLAMLCVVVVFGAHSLIDWTWYVPGNACVALLCAGWLAGRGPLDAPVGAILPLRRAARPSRPRAALAGVAIVAALLAAWTQWQPQRSEEANQQAEALLAGNPTGATAAAHSAVARDPLSIKALTVLATVQSTTGHTAMARATLEKAVRLQPSNPEAWLTLGRFDLTANPRAALHELQAGIYLNPELIAHERITAPTSNPESVEIYNDYIQALRATQPPAASLNSANGSPSRAGSAARRAARRRSAPGAAQSQSQSVVR
jgi:hypothetical protein